MSKAWKTAMVLGLILVVMAIPLLPSCAQQVAPTTTPTATPKVIVATPTPGPTPTLGPTPTPQVIVVTPTPGPTPTPQVVVVTPTPAPTARPTATAGKLAPIRIGGIRDLSGGHAVAGNAERIGAMLALDEANDEGGINGHPIEYSIVDDQGAPDKATSIATRFITRDNVVAISGSTTSGCCLAIGQVAAPKKIPMVGSGYSQQLHDGVKDPTKIAYWYFAEGSDTNGLIRTNLVAVKQDNIKTVALIYTTAVFTQGCADLAKQLAGEYGYTVAAEIPIQEAATDATAQVAKAKAANPQGLLVASLYQETGAIVRAMKAVNWNVPVYCIAGTTSDMVLKSLGPSLAEGITSSTICDLQTIEVRAAIERAKKRYGLDIPDEGYFILAYDGNRALVEALRRAKNPYDTSEVRQLLETGVNDVIVHGMAAGQKVGYNPNHHVLYEYHLVSTIRKGEVVVR